MLRRAASWRMIASSMSLSWVVWAMLDRWPLTSWLTKLGSLDWMRDMML